MLPLVVALLGLMQGTAVAQSYLAERAAEHGSLRCSWGDGPAYATLELAYCVTAEILHYSDCYDECQNGGCISHIIVGERAHEIRGSEPFRLDSNTLGMFGFEGFRQHPPVGTAIGWIENGRLLTGYWNDDERMMIYTGGRDITGMF